MNQAGCENCHWFQERKSGWVIFRFHFTSARRKPNWLGKRNQSRSERSDTPRKQFGKLCYYAPLANMNSATHRLFIAGTLALASLVTSTCQQSERTELTLYRARRWLELREVVSPRSSALIGGVVAAAFNDPAHAERLLRGVIREPPPSLDAAEV